MAELKDCLIDLGLTDVKTYLQTGNVVFTSEQKPSDWKPLIEAALSQRFGYTAFVLIFPFSLIQQVLDECPFAETEGKHRYVVFGENQEVISELAAFSSQLDPALEAIASGSSALYWQLPKGSSTETPFSKIIAKAKYKAVTTTRNWNTLQKMAAG